MKKEKPERFAHEELAQMSKEALIDLVFRRSGALGRELSEEELEDVAGTGHQATFHRQYGA
jgi:uncharacterized protein YjiS (DUF1127 family)